MDRNLLILIGVVGASLSSVAAWLLFRKAPDPQERERQRLDGLEQSGRIVVGEIDHIAGTVVTYSYEVASVGYVAAQDLGVLFEVQPEELEKLSGHISVKYDRANPSNSMVHAERWSGIGLREPKQERPKLIAGDESA